VIAEIAHFLGVYRWINPAMMPRLVGHLAMIVLRP